MSSETPLTFIFFKMVIAPPTSDKSKYLWKFSNFINYLNWWCKLQRGYPHFGVLHYKHVASSASQATKLLRNGRQPWVFALHLLRRLDESGSPHPRDQARFFWGFQHVSAMKFHGDLMGMNWICCQNVAEGPPKWWGWRTAKMVALMREIIIRFKLQTCKVAQKRCGETRVDAGVGRNFRCLMVNKSGCQITLNHP